MLLHLQHFNLKIKYVQGKLMFIADTLSRDYLNDTEQSSDYNND